MEKFNVQVNSILLSLQSKMGDVFGNTNIDRKIVLALAKELGYLQGKRGRDGGTFATEMGMAFANLSGEIIRPVTKEERKAAKLAAKEVQKALEATAAASTETPPQLTLSEVA